MISEILEILGTLVSSTKNDNPKDSKKDSVLSFLSYTLGIVCFILIITEYEIIINLENRNVFILVAILASIFLAALTIYILKSLNLLSNLKFSSFISISISLFLLFTLLFFLMINYFNF